jgi:hypothetical protein
MIAYGFAGAILGLFMVSIFKPQTHKEIELPLPGTNIFHTPSGCVKIRSEEVSCSTEAISLNVINDRKNHAK